MKRFHELTKEQQTQAVNFARRELEDCLRLQLVKSDKELSNEELTEYAMCAAIEAFYSEPHDKVVDGIAGEE